MKRSFWWCLPALLLLLLLPALAQAQQRSSKVVDEVGQLNVARVQQSAAVLERQGAVVAAYLVNQGSEADLDRRLVADGFQRDDGIKVKGLVAVYVSLEPRNAIIRYEDTWNAALGRTVNGVPNWSRILDEVLKPELRTGFERGDFTDAFLKTLGEVNGAILSPPEELPVDTFPIGAAIAGIGALGVGAAVGVPALRRRRAAARSLAGARTAFEEARRRAGAAIADTAALFKTAEEKATYDKISYTPADVGRLDALMGQSRSQFASSKERFDEIEEQLQGKKAIGQGDYEQAAPAYDAVTAQVAEARSAVEQAEGLRAELDTLRRQASSDLDAAKKA